MIAQHDHAKLSGMIASHLQKQFFVDHFYIEDVLFAVYEHDRSWIRLDDTPIWNDRTSAPFSFNDYPLLPKLALYRIGMDEIEERNQYAALLCSLHYSSFRMVHNAANEECVRFYDHERKRQETIRGALNDIHPDVVARHFRLLQLCDDISLYVCLNEAGVRKENEHPWFMKGFKNSSVFNLEEDKPLYAKWLTDKKIRIYPTPFQKTFHAAVQLKRVSKDSAHRLGIHEAYKNTGYTDQELIFVG